MKEPLPPATVKRFLSSLVAAGTLSFTKHAYEEMAKDYLTEIDVRNTLKGGTARPGELVSGTWRYRMETSRMAAVAPVGDARRRRDGLAIPGITTGPARWDIETRDERPEEQTR